MRTWEEQEDEQGWSKDVDRGDHAEGRISRRGTRARARRKAHPHPFRLRENWSLLGRGNWGGASEQVSLEGHLCMRPLRWQELAAVVTTLFVLHLLYLAAVLPDARHSDERISGVGNILVLSNGDRALLDELTPHFLHANIHVVQAASSHRTRDTLLPYIRSHSPVPALPTRYALEASWEDFQVGGLLENWTVSDLRKLLHSPFGFRRLVVLDRPNFLSSLLYTLAARDQTRRCALLITLDVNQPHHAARGLNLSQLFDAWDCWMREIRRWASELETLLLQDEDYGITEEFDSTVSVRQGADFRRSSSR